jgi:hypothetical protein
MFSKLVSRLLPKQVSHHPIIRESSTDWLTVYFCIGLDCDTPILESLYHSQMLDYDQAISYAIQSVNNILTNRGFEHRRTTNQYYGNKMHWVNHIQNQSTIDQHVYIETELFKGKWSLYIIDNENDLGWVCVSFKPNSTYFQTNGHHSRKPQTKHNIRYCIEDRVEWAIKSLQ